MLTDILNVVTWANLARLSDLLSLISIGVAVVTFWKVRALRKDFTARARLPEIVKALKGAATRFSELAEGIPETAKSIRVTVKECEASLLSLTGKVPWGL